MVIKNRLPMYDKAANSRQAATREPKPILKTKKEKTLTGAFETGVLFADVVGLLLIFTYIGL